MRYVMYCRFCGWRRVFTKRSEWAESVTTRMFRLVRQMAASGRSLPFPTACCLVAWYNLCASFKVRISTLKCSARGGATPRWSCRSWWKKAAENGRSVDKLISLAIWHRVGSLACCSFLLFDCVLYDKIKTFVCIHFTSNAVSAVSNICAC